MKNQIVISEKLETTSSTLERFSPFTGLIEVIETVWDGKLCKKKAIIARNLYLSLGLNPKNYAKWEKERIIENFTLKVGVDFNKIKSRSSLSKGETGKSRKPHNKRPDIAIRIQLAKQLCITGRDKHIAKACSDWLEKEISAAYKAQEYMIKQKENIDLNPVFQQLLAAGIAAATEKAQELVDNANRRATEHHKRFLIASDETRDKRDVKALRGDIVNIVRSIARIQQNQTAEGYESIYRTAYKELMRMSFYPWKADFWESKNKLDFLESKGKDKLERVKMILEARL